MIAIQQSEELRSRYVAEVSLYDPAMLVFLDETSLASRHTEDRKRQVTIALVPWHGGM